MKKAGKQLILILIAAILAVIFCSTKCTRKQPEKANLVIIVADALRRDVLGCYGGDVPTPNIDGLARNGVLFKHAYSTAPTTMPSSVSIFTGNYSRVYGVAMKKITGYPQNFFYYVNDKEKTLSEFLGELGYDVRMDVENKLAYSSNNMQGFKKFRDFKKLKEKEIAEVENTIGIKNLGRHRTDFLSSNYDRLYDLLFYLLNVPQDQKFCLVKWFLDPHAPYRPPKKFRKEISVDPEKLSHRPSFYSQKQHYDMEKFSDYEKYYLKELYKAEVASLDERVGFIIKALKHRNLLDKTIIVFTSDHGESFGEMKQWGHGTNFSECLVHVPLIFMGPGIPVGKIEEDIVSHLDLMPTLKTLLGIVYDDNMQGKSYDSLFQGETIPIRTPYFDRNRHPSPRMTLGDVDGLLMDGHKLTVKRKKEKLSFKLFNLADDPEELNNLAQANFNIVQKMLKKIMDIRKSNKLRLKTNQKKINRNINMDKKWKRVRERLKTLGYIE